MTWCSLSVRNKIRLNNLSSETDRDCQEAFSIGCCLKRTLREGIIETESPWTTSCIVESTGRPLVGGVGGEIEKRAEIPEQWWGLGFQLSPSQRRVVPQGAQVQDEFPALEVLLDLVLAP